jgi:PilZ domain
VKDSYTKPAIGKTVVTPEFKDDGEGRRRVQRFSFVATAELTDPISQTSIHARVTELSLYGCYVEMANPLPCGALIFVKIFNDSDFFEASASVIYSQENLGFGLAFRDVNPRFFPTLKKWLLQAMRPSGT